MEVVLENAFEDSRFSIQNRKAELPKSLQKLNDENVQNNKGLN